MLSGSVLTLNLSYWIVMRQSMCPLQIACFGLKPFLLDLAPEVSLNIKNRATQPCWRKCSLWLLMCSSGCGTT